MWAFEVAVPGRRRFNRRKRGQTMEMRRLFAFLWAFAASGAVGSAGVEVTTHQWGFDGKVVPESINILSVQLTNSSVVPYDGTVVLEKRRSGMGTRLGAQLVQPCYVSPGASRLVQFTPYVGHGTATTWVLILGRQEVDLGRAAVGPPARVFLSEPEGSRPPPGMRTCRSDFMPPTVAAMDGLAEVFLDHAPRWEPARRTALAEWLFRGGTVHVCHDRTGRWPTFPPELDTLNAPGSADAPATFGAGVVVGHDRRAFQVTDRYLAALEMFPRPVLENNNAVYLRFEETVFAKLKSLTNPDFNWPVIFVLIALYMIAVGPLNYLLARRRRWQWAFGFFLAAVALFGMAFSHVGRRGFGERTRCDSLGYARHLGGTRYDVTHWAHVFVTSGAYHTIDYPGRWDLFSTCQEMETVNGVVAQVPGGAFRVDLPLFSGREFLHRGTLEGGSMAPAVRSWRTDGDVPEVTLTPGRDWPPSPLMMGAILDGRWYEVRAHDGILEVMPGSASELQQQLATEATLNQGHNAYTIRHQRYTHTGPPHAIHQQCFFAVVARSLGRPVGFRHRFTLRRPLPDRLDLYVLCESPETFRVSGDALKPGAEYTVFHHTLRKPATADGNAPREKAEDQGPQQPNKKGDGEPENVGAQDR